MNKINYIELKILGWNKIDKDSFIKAMEDERYRNLVETYNGFPLSKSNQYFDTLDYLTIHPQDVIGSVKYIDSETGTAFINPTDKVKEYIENATSECHIAPRMIIDGSNKDVMIVKKIISYDIKI